MLPDHTLTPAPQMTLHRDVAHGRTGMPGALGTSANPVWPSPSSTPPRPGTTQGGKSPPPGEATEYLITVLCGRRQPPPYPNKPRAPQAPRPGPEARGRQETLGSPPENSSTGSGRRTNYPRNYLLRSLPTGGGAIPPRAWDTPIAGSSVKNSLRPKCCRWDAPCLSPTRTVVARRWRRRHVLGCEPITVGRTGELNPCRERPKARSDLPPTGRLPRTHR